MKRLLPALAALSLLLAPVTSALAAGQPLLIDVRTPAEYEAGHLPGAALAPVEQIARDIVRLAPDKDTPITLYCRSGRRSEAARQTLLGMGYTRVTNAGGYEELKQKSATRP